MVGYTLLLDQSIRMGSLINLAVDHDSAVIDKNADGVEALFGDEVKQPVHAPLLQPAECPARALHAPPVDAFDQEHLAVCQELAVGARLEARRDNVGGVSERRRRSARWRTRGLRRGRLVGTLSCCTAAAARRIVAQLAARPLGTPALAMVWRRRWRLRTLVLQRTGQQRAATERDDAQPPHGAHFVSERPSHRALIPQASVVTAFS